MIFLKSKDQIKTMHEANVIVHSVLDEAEKSIDAGITTQELNDIMENKMISFSGATSAFKGYKGFPDVACISVNEEVVHGIPSDRVILPGDIVSVDFGVFYKGFAGDAARTFIVGNVDKAIRNLVNTTKDGLYEGVKNMTPDAHIYDIGRAIALVASNHGYGNVKGFCGHGIGEKMHELPHVYNYVETAEPNVRLRAGMVFALEPMFNLGTSDVIVCDDGWTVVTRDKMPSAHWELSVAVTDDGPLVLGK